MAADREYKFIRRALLKEITDLEAKEQEKVGKPHNVKGKQLCSLILNTSRSNLCSIRSANTIH